MSSLLSPRDKQKCTLIETFHGELKLIIRLDDSPADLETLKFSSLKDCMEYVDKNKFQITVTHSGENETARKGKL